MTRMLLVSAALAASLVTAVAPAEARDLSPGAAAAVGVLGGLAIGGAIAGAAAQPYYPGRQVSGPAPMPEYVPPPPRRVYYEDDAGPVCVVRRRRFVDEYGDVVIRRERVCD